MAKQMATKNLQNISDILGAEKLNYEKVCYYSEIAKDPALINLLSELKEASKAHYGAVYNYLKSHQQ
ncbi:MAG: hypothetical protein GX242_03530 [Clostridiales bacterium]|nr:hypothetical protein [Clostridiales bacterium]